MAARGAADSSGGQSQAPSGQGCQNPLSPFPYHLSPFTYHLSPITFGRGPKRMKRSKPAQTGRAFSGVPKGTKRRREAKTRAFPFEALVPAAVLRVLAPLPLAAPRRQRGKRLFSRDQLEARWARGKGGFG
jgi:hypothetical protein